MRIQLVEQDPALLGALKEACQNDYFHSEACSKMRGLEDTIGRVATTDSTVLIVGETGTGKELAARASASHQHAERQTDRDRQLCSHSRNAH